MPVHIVADTFLQRYDHQITAAVTLLITALLVAVANRALSRRGKRLAAVVAGGEISRGADTRLRFLRRLVAAGIVLIGVALALSQFTALDQLGRTVLASSAITAAVVGFAARQVLANAIAGLQLAVTQPVRIGDTVTFEGELGVVEDIRLTSTWLRTPADARIIVPNERLAAGVLRNDSIISPTVASEASVWLTHEQDAAAAVDVVRKALPDASVVIAETTAEGVRMLVSGPAMAPALRAREESKMRESALRAIAAAADRAAAGR
jgi:small conductance mechanosensitive channel